MRFDIHHTPQRFKYQYSNVITHVDIHVVVKTSILHFIENMKIFHSCFAFLNTLLEHLLLKVSYYVFVDIKLMRSNLVFHKCWVRGRKRRLKRCNKTDNRRRNINYALLSKKKGQLSERKIFIVGVIKKRIFCP